LSAEIERHNVPECVGVCIEDPFGMNRQACKVLDMMVGVAIVTCERLVYAAFASNADCRSSVRTSSTSGAHNDLRIIFLPHGAF
jgi:hypothetical protein